MSDLVFPELPGLVYPVIKQPMWSNKIQTSTSGKETRTSFWSYPVWDYKISYDFLRSGIQAEMQTLIGFFNSRQGNYDSWLFNDPDDNSVSFQSLGTGDGSTTAFQLLRTLGGFTEPVSLLPTQSPTVIIDSRVANLMQNSDFQTKSGASQPWGFAPYSVATTSFTNPIGQFALTAMGIKATSAAAGVFGFTSSSVFSGGGVLGGVRNNGWKPNNKFVLSFYARKVNGSSLSTMYLAWNTNPESVTILTNPVLTTAYQRYVFLVSWGNIVEPNGGFFVSANGPVAINDELQISALQVIPGTTAEIFIAGTQSYVLNSKNAIVFDQAPTNGASIGWSGNYYWRCRFLDDRLELSKFMDKLWSSKSIAFRSLK
jgi:Conserved hypothetical protein 2217 (DUF2460)